MSEKNTFELSWFLKESRYYKYIFEYPFFTFLMAILAFYITYLKGEKFPKNIEPSIVVIILMGGVSFLFTLWTKWDKWLKSLTIDTENKTFIFLVLGTKKSFTSRFSDIERIDIMPGTSRFYFRDGTWVSWAKMGIGITRQDEVDEIIKGLGIPVTYPKWLW